MTHHTEELKQRRKGLLVPFTPPPFYHPHSHPACTAPTVRVPLANLPTPIQRWSLPELPEDVGIDIKRDDYTGGIETTGNKVRKLEFLLAAAIEDGVDGVVTAGGTQSNHARATAASCARLFHLPCHLYLRKDSEGRNGNFLLDQLVGANIYEITREQQMAWKADSGEAWVEQRAVVLSNELECRITGIPIGGSNSLGCWGYLNCVQEMSEQLHGSIEETYSHIAACTGSGGTLGGLGVGLYLYKKHKHLPNDSITLQTYSVSDSPEYFLNYITDITCNKVFQGPSAHTLMRMTDVKGEGYAKSTTEELQFISRVARETGVILDFCYTGKTVFGLWKELTHKAWQPLSGRKALYIHTGGGPSVFDRADLFQNVLQTPAQ